jgi:hypothetical protein
MTISSGLVPLLRDSIKTWHESSNSKQRDWSQVEVNLRSIGTNHPVGSVLLRWETWCEQRAHSEDLRGQWQARVSTIMADSSLTEEEKDTKIDSLREPRLVPSAEDRLSASTGKALQVAESFLLWLDLQEDVPSSCANIRLSHLRRFTFAFIGLYMFDLAESFMKLKLATIEAIAKRQIELPPVKDPFLERNIRSPRIFPGQFGHQLGNWINRTLARNFSFVFWMKRGMPRVSTDMIKAQEEASFKILTSPQLLERVSIPTKSGRVREIDLSDLVVQVIRTSKEVFSSARRWSDVQPFQLPSANAHFGTTRAMGGARAIVADSNPTIWNGCFRFLRELPGIQSFIELDRLSMDFHGVAQACRSETSDLNPIFRHAGLFAREESLRGTECCVHFLEEFALALSARSVLKHSTPERCLEARIIGLAEPLKVRTITAGSERHYYWLRYLQKFLHGHLRKHDVFRLIGSPLSLEDIHRTFWRRLRPDQFFVSGDYKDATNLISSTLSEAAARAIASAVDMPDHITKMFVDGLVNHKVFCGLDKEGHQRNGQLMGSPVSFPILCLINAALTRFSLELEDECSYRLDELPLLINGDDVGFVTTARGYEIWKKITRVGGLQFSIGKNFTSRDFLVLNSCMFQLRSTSIPSPMRSYGGPRHVVSQATQPGQSIYAQRIFGLSSHFPVETPENPEDRLKFLLEYTRFQLRTLEPVDRQFCRLPKYRQVPPYPQPLREEHNWDFAHHGPMPYPLCRRYSYRATERNNWFTDPYLNPDYLGPAGRWTPIVRDACDLRCGDAAGNHKTGDPHLRCPAFDRFRIRDVNDLFCPEGYAILPGLQKAWLGVSTGSRRHSLNQVFIRSWKPVLDLTSGIHRDQKWSVCWWLPTGLGGLGLENTEPGFSVESLPILHRKLASYLRIHPEHVPSPMPVIAFADSAKQRVSEALGRFQPIFKKDIDLCLVQHDDLLTFLMGQSWMSGFGSIDADEPHGFERGQKEPYLHRRLFEFSRSRARWWLSRSKAGHLEKWRDFRPLTDAMLAAWYHPVRQYSISLPSGWKVDAADPNKIPSDLLSELLEEFPWSELCWFQEKDSRFPSRSCLG